AFARALELDPHNGSYALDLAQTRIVLASAGLAEIDDALAALDHALTVQPYSPVLRQRAVQLNLLLGRADEALEQAEALVWVLPRHVRAYAPLMDLLAARAEAAMLERRPADAYA